MENRKQDDIGEILDTLIDARTSEDIELSFLIEQVSEKVTRRQALILRLLLMGITSQVAISKYLGFSASTINMDLKKIKEIFARALKGEGRDYSKYIVKEPKNTIKDSENNSVLNIEGDNSNGTKPEDSEGDRTQEEDSKTD